MVGSLPFSLKKTTIFEKTFKKLVKSYKSKTQQQEFVSIIGNDLENLILDPYPPQYQLEPLPGGFRLPDTIQFRKLVIIVAKGASGQIRLMYLVNKETRVIQLLWIYSHEDFPKRPPDKDLKNALKAVLEEEY